MHCFDLGASFAIKKSLGVDVFTWNTASSGAVTTKSITLRKLVARTLHVQLSFVTNANVCESYNPPHATYDLFVKA